MEIEDKIAILADLWLNFRDDPSIEDFVAYNDLGLPLAYAVHAALSEITDDGIPYVEETYNLLAESLGLDMDEDFSTLQEMFHASSDKEE
jgi:hypothetical protein